MEVLIINEEDLDISPDHLEADAKGNEHIDANVSEQQEGVTGDSNSGEIQMGVPRDDEVISEASKKDTLVGDLDGQDDSSEVLKEEEVAADLEQNDKNKEIKEGSDSEIRA